MNLWTNLDDNGLPDDVMVQRRTRRLNERTAQSLLRDWLLNDYVAAYCRSLAETRIFRRCYWIDALGVDARANALPPARESVEQSVAARTRKGRKKELEQQLPPALQPIASLSRLLAQESKPIALYGLVLEGGSSKRKNTKLAQDGMSSMARKIILPKESGIIRDNWLAVAPALLKEIEQAPGIFLLNPFGATMFSHADLTLIHQRSVPTELCLLAPHKQVETHLHMAQRSPIQASVLTELLRTDRWKTLLMRGEDHHQAIDGLIELFATAMKRHFLLPVQCIALPVQRRPAVIEPMPYTLIFATRRQDSFICMNDAVCLYSRRVYEQSRHGVLAEEWLAAQQREQLKEELEQLYLRTLQQGRTQRSRRWPELRQHLLLANFGKFLLHEYDSIMQKLLANGEVRCEWRQRVLAHEEERVPKQDDTLIWR